MKQILPVVTIAVSVFAFPAFACDLHQDHTAMKTVETVPASPAPTAAPASQMVIKPAAQSNPALEIMTENPMSVPLAAAYGNCHRSRQNQTVYLTQ